MTIHLKKSTVIAALAMMSGSTASGATIPLFNTGVGNVGQPLPASSVDANWRVIGLQNLSSIDPAYVVTDQSGLNFYFQTSNSRWIWVTPDANAQINVTYHFQIQFDLTGFDHESARLQGVWGADNLGRIELNEEQAIGNGVFALNWPDANGNNFRNAYAFAITGGFKPGLNSLDVFARDVGNPGGINVSNLLLTADAVSTPSPVSSPSPLSLLISALVLMFARRRADA